MITFREFLAEAKLAEATVNKFSKEDFESENFQNWIKKSMGKSETEGNITIVYNKMDKPIFSWDSKRELLNILQKDLSFDHLKSYTK